MKKLSSSLIIIIFVTIILLGWGIDAIFVQFSRGQQTDEVTPYRNIVSALASSLDTSGDAGSFVNKWRGGKNQQLSLIELQAFPLPTELLEELTTGKSLVLESSQNISIHALLATQQKVLTLTIPKKAEDKDNTELQIALTTLFYSGILVGIFIWLYPLTRQLHQLRASAKAFGEGEFGYRIAVSPASYLSDIETEFNRMAQKIETLINDNKLLGNAVSHDLRTPLARLRFGIEALSETENPDKKDKYIQRLSSDISEMEKLVAVLLNYARLDQSMVEMEQASVDLNQLIDECVYSLELTPDGPKARHVSWTAKGKPIVIGDENFLRMLVSNLLNNAVVYAKRHISIDVQSTSKQLMLIIADDGEGVPKDKTEELFNPFTRGPNSFENTGFGMGLAIVARVAQWHNASVKIEDSNTLGGAEFTVTFPLS